VGLILELGRFVLRFGIGCGDVVTMNCSITNGENKIHASDMLF